MPRLVRNFYGKCIVKIVREDVKIRVFCLIDPEGVVINIGVQKTERAVRLSVCPSDATRLPNYKGSRAKLNILLKSMTRGWF